MMLAFRKHLKKSHSLVNPIINMNQLITVPKKTVETPVVTKGVKAAILVKRLVNTTAANTKKGAVAPTEVPITMYPLNKVRYMNNNRLPMLVLCDVPRTVKKALEALNLN